MLLQTAGHSDSSLKRRPRHWPPPTKVPVLAAQTVSLAAGTQQNLRQRCAALVEQSASGFGWCADSRMIFSRGTPASSTASATERNEEPLSPGPSSTIKNPAALEIPL